MLARKGLNDTRIWEMQKERLIASILVQPHLKKGANLKPTDLFKLPGDGKNVDLNKIKAKNILAELKKREAQVKISGRKPKDNN